MPFQASSLAMVQSTRICKHVAGLHPGARSGRRAWCARIFCVSVIGWGIAASASISSCAFHSIVTSCERSNAFIFYDTEARETERRFPRAS